LVKRIIKHIHDNTPEIHPHKIKIPESHINRLQSLEDFLYEKALFKVPLFVGLALVVRFIIVSLFTTDHIFANFVSVIIYMFITIYLVFFVVHLVKKSFKSLLTAKNMGALFFSYALFMFSIILFFASAYDTADSLDKGYITYSICSDNFSPEKMHSDTGRSERYFYFSSITLFTVGYGDLCPMGWSKTIAVINAFVGNFINVILMVLVISNYLNRKNPNCKNY
jgi:potassium channel LctB